MPSLLAKKTSNPYRPGRQSALAALDIGSANISCLIASPEAVSDDRKIQIRGAGSHSSQGVQSGAVTEMEALELSIRIAVQQAEQAASVQVNDVVVSISGPDLQSVTLSAELPLHGREITTHHTHEVMHTALRQYADQDREIMHVTPIGFGVDNSFGIHDPQGMCAHHLNVTLIAVTAPSAALRNVMQCVARAHLNPLAIIAAPYASGLACLVSDELDGGAVLLDMGAESTGMAAFRDKALIWLGSIPVGGAHASADLAQGLGTTFAAAERLKTLNGAASLSQIDAFDMLEAPRLGADGHLEASSIARGELTGILRPRIEEIFEMVQHRLSEAEIRPMPRRIVLTGGASALPGICEVAADIFDSPVRLARTLRTKGAGEMYDSPAFSAVSGIFCHQFGGTHFDPLSRFNQSKNVFSRALTWLRYNF